MVKIGNLRGKMDRETHCDPAFLTKVHETLIIPQTEEKDEKFPQFRTLLTYGSDVNISDLKVSQALVNERRIEARRLLTHRGAGGCDGIPTDIEDLEALHLCPRVRTRIHARSSLVKLLVSEGLEINCPRIAGDLDPLGVEEASQRFSTLKTLVQSGTDTNRVQIPSRCEFCVNLQFLRNFGTGEEMQEEESPEDSWKRLLLKNNKLLNLGQDINCLKWCQGPCSLPLSSSSLCPFLNNKDNEKTVNKIAEMLAMNGHKINCPFYNSSEDEDEEDVTQMQIHN